jgi:hypothetical protein
MTTTQLKNILTQKISKIDDNDFLNAIRIIIEMKENAGDVYKLNEIQRQRIKKSKEQIKNGGVIDNDQVFDEIEKWLKEK